MEASIMTQSFAANIGAHLDDEPAEKIFIIIRYENSYDSSLYKVENGKFSAADMRESMHVLEVTDGEGPESMDALEKFEKPGIYVLYFKNKKLSDYQFIEKKNEYLINNCGEICAIAINKIYGLKPEKDEDAAKLEENLEYENIFNEDNNIVAYTDDGIKIKVIGKIRDGREHIQKDFELLAKGLDRVEKEVFIPWLKGEKFADRDNQKVDEGIKPYEVEYERKENYGAFSFYVRSQGDYTRDMFDAACISCNVNDDGIIESSVECRYI